VPLQVPLPSATIQKEVLSKVSERSSLPFSWGLWSTTDITLRHWGIYLITKLQMFSQMLILKRYAKSLTIHVLLTCDYTNAISWCLNMSIWR
jgi:hypothetical protein